MNWEFRPIPTRSGCGLTNSTRSDCGLTNSTPSDSGKEPDPTSFAPSWPAISSSARCSHSSPSS